MRLCLGRVKISRLIPIIIVSAFEATMAQSPDSSPSPTPPPKTRVQIVNATSVAAIDLSTNGIKEYQNFKQGKFTGDAATDRLKVQYTAEDKKSGAVASSKEFKYSQDTTQTLVILGDFSTEIPPETLRQPGPAPTPPEKPYPPNVIFRAYPHAAEDLPAKVRLRVVNGMPGKALSFQAKDQKLTLKPGDEQALKSQDPVFVYNAEIEGNQISILMKQDSDPRNAMIVFFLKPDGQPAFQRIFEN